MRSTLVASVIILCGCFAASCDTGTNEPVVQISKIRIDSVVPSSAMIGDTIRIIGKGFLKGKSLTFEGGSITILTSSVSDTSMVIRLGYAERSGNLLMTSDSGEAYASLDVMPLIKAQNNPFVGSKIKLVILDLNNVFLDSFQTRTLIRDYSSVHLTSEMVALGDTLLYYWNEDDGMTRRTYDKIEFVWDPQGKTVDCYEEHDRVSIGPGSVDARFIAILSNAEVFHTRNGLLLTLGGDALKQVSPSFSETLKQREIQYVPKIDYRLAELAANSRMSFWLLP